MRKLSALLAALMLGGFLGMAATAGAESVTTDIGTVAVAQDGYLVVVDGNSGNEDPSTYSDGYIGVTEDGAVVCDGDDGPFNDDGTANEDHEDGGCP